jgi:CMP-N,N'-diacetyllegionaminic acid synthase
MINQQKILAIIPARGGSKGLPRKNILNLAGKPLLAWTIEAAQKSCYIDRLILSSDDEKIISVAKEYKCDVPFIRPSSLATDTTPGISPILHAIQHVKEYDYIILLQPTSPLRTTEDIDKSIEICIEKNAPACVSITESSEHPFHTFFFTNENKLTSVISNIKIPNRRQDCPTTFRLNGAIYIANIPWLIKNESFISEQTIGYEMPSIRSIDIDNRIDFLLAETIIKETLLDKAE